MHRKAINPLQELIWSTLAYLLWHGRRFYIPAGRIREKKEMFFLVSKSDDTPGLAPILSMAITCYGNQCRPLVVNSPRPRLRCSLRKL